MPFAKTNDGHEIYYEQHGTSGPLLVLVSGYFGITNNWQPLISKLKSDHQLIAFDNRGYGRSSKPESPAAYSIPRHAEDLGAVLKSANVNSKVILVTHSMGGNIASAFTLSNPDLVSGIISSGVYYDGKSLRDVGITADMLVSNAELPSRAVDFYVKMGLDPSFAIEAAHWPAYARRNNALALLEYEIGDGYAKIKVPALMVQGAEAYARRNNALALLEYEIGDGYAKIKVPALKKFVQPIADAMPSCRIQVLKGVNHFPLTEAVDEFYSLIVGFVKSV